MSEKRFTLGKEYDVEGNYEHCYVDEETRRTFNFADEYCEEDFLKLVNTVIDNLKKENEQLKKDVEYWKQVASQYSNKLNVFEHFKKHKTECKDIHWSSD